MSYRMDMIAASGRWDLATDQERKQFKPDTAPAWMPPVYPQYRIWTDGLAFSCMTYEGWEGGSPDDDVQVFFKAQHNRTKLMEIGGYIVFEFPPETCPFNPDGSKKPLPQKLIIGSAP